MTNTTNWNGKDMYIADDQEAIDTGTHGEFVVDEDGMDNIEELDPSMEGWFYGTIADFTDIVDEEGIKKVWDNLPDHIQDQLREHIAVN